MKSDKAQLRVYLRRIAQQLLEKEIPCPNDQLLSDYFKESLSEDKMEKVRSHVALCDHCIERLLQMDKSFDSSKVESLLNSAMLHEDWRKLKNKIEKDRNRRNKTTIILRLAASIVLIIAGSLGGLFLTRPDAYSLAKINPEVELKKLSTFRGDDPLSRGVFSLKNKDFNRANEIFMSYVNENPENFDGHYYLGITLLFKAESGLLSAFRFGQTHVEQAIAHLQTALSLVQDNPRQAANCHWFLGKAYLMKGEIKLAESQFRKILAVSEPNIKRKQAAEKILRDMKPKKRSRWPR